MFVLTLDQVKSRSSQDLVPAFLKAWRSSEFDLPFERTAGDEVQGATSNARVVRDIALACLRDGQWHVGIGAGSVEPGADSARSGRGAAFVDARAAVDAAKSVPRFSASIAVRSHDHPETAAHAEALLRLIGALYARRTAAQWEAIDLFSDGHSVSTAAKKLGISVEAASQRRGYSGWSEEAAIVPLLDAMLEQLGES